MAEKLNAADVYPGMTLTPVDGDPITLPGDISGRYQVVLFYRGHW